MSPGAAPDPRDPLAPLRSKTFVTEAQRKAIHLSFIVLPLELLFQTLPWPRGRGQFRLLFLGLVIAAIAVDLLRIHERRVRETIRAFFGEMIREHERFTLLGSTYLLLAALLAIEIFPLPVAAAALGFTVLGDGFAALVGRGWGRVRVFKKSLEGAIGGFVACLLWGAFVASTGTVPWAVLMTGAVVASAIELLPIPLDDNLGITLFSGYAMKLMLSAG